MTTRTRFSALLFAVAVLVGPQAHAAAWILPGVLARALPAQAPVDPPEDPFLRAVNAQLDGEEAAIAAAPEPAPVTAPPDRGGFYYLRVFSALCLVLALIIAAGYLLKRAGGNTALLAGDDLGRIIGRIHLSRNSTLFFVETAGRVLIIGATPTSISQVADFDRARFDADGSADALAPESFIEQLRAGNDALAGERAHPPRGDDNEILSLRRDMERLHEYLKEESSESLD